MPKALKINLLCILIAEKPAGYIERQPVYYDKFVVALDLKPTRLCRCKLYDTPHREETIVLNNMTQWSPNNWGLPRRMCAADSPYQPLITNKTHTHL